MLKRIFGICIYFANVKSFIAATTLLTRRHPSTRRLFLRRCCLRSIADLPFLRRSLDWRIALIVPCVLIISWETRSLSTVVTLAARTSQLTSAIYFTVLGIKFATTTIGIFRCSFTHMATLVTFRNAIASIGKVYSSDTIIPYKHSLTISHL